MNRILHFFNLHEGEDKKETVLEDVIKNISFRGANACDSCLRYRDRIGWPQRELYSSHYWRHAYFSVDGTYCWGWHFFALGTF